MRRPGGDRGPRPAGVVMLCCCAAGGSAGGAAALDQLRSSDRTLDGAWLACASIAVPAWDRICERVKLIISCAMSVSRIRLSDADRFSTATLRLLILCS